jgi:hypothetical protein
LKDVFCVNFTGAIVQVEKEGPPFTVVPTMEACNMKASTLVIA